VGVTLRGKNGVVLVDESAGEVGEAGDVCLETGALRHQRKSRPFSQTEWGPNDELLR
jgi:hypothetical protein